MNGSRVFMLLIAVLWGAQPSAFAGEVDLEWRITKQPFAVNDTAEIALFAVSSDGFDQAFSVVEAVVLWDPIFLELVGLSDDGPYEWLASRFPDDSGFDGLNAPFTGTPDNDGDAVYNAWSQFPPSAPAVATSEGLLITKFVFRARHPDPSDVVLAPSAGSFTFTRVHDATAPNTFLTGTLGPPATVVPGDSTLPPQPEPPPDGGLKNRYISVALPPFGGQPTALRVHLTSLHHPSEPATAPDFSAFEGEVRYVATIKTCQGGNERVPGATTPFFSPNPARCESQADCDARTDANGDPLNGTCLPTVDCLDSEVYSIVFKCATLSCVPEYRDWSGEVGSNTLHITGAAIVPSSRYDVSQLDMSCAGSEDTCVVVSAPLPIFTAQWGDVSPGTLNALDITTSVDRLKDLPTGISKPQAQLHPADVDPTRKINVLEVMFTVDALKSFPYPFSIGTCP